MHIGNLFLAEFIGTMFIVLFGNGVVAALILKHSKFYKKGLNVSIGWGFALILAVLVTGKVNGAGQLNPAVTIGLWLASFFKNTYEHASVFQGKEWLICIYLVAQFLGAFAGQIILDIIYWLQIENYENKDLILEMHSTGPAKRNEKNSFDAKSLFISLFVEIVGTALLFMVAISIESIFNNEKNIAIFSDAKAYIVGITVVGLVMTFGGANGPALNPARDLAPRIIYTILPIKHKISADWNYSWVPVVGPILGATLMSMLTVLMCTINQ